MRIQKLSEYICINIVLMRQTSRNTKLQMESKISDDCNFTIIIIDINAISEC